MSFNITWIFIVNLIQLRWMLWKWMSFRIVMEQINAKSFEFNFLIHFQMDMFYFSLRFVLAFVCLNTSISFVYSEFLCQMHWHAYKYSLRLDWLSLYLCQIIVIKLLTKRNKCLHDFLSQSIIPHSKTNPHFYDPKIAKFTWVQLQNATPKNKLRKRK